MDETIRKYTSPDEMKADEYRYWQSGPVHERMGAVDEMIDTACAGAWKVHPRNAQVVRWELKISTQAKSLLHG